MQSGFMRCLVGLMLVCSTGMFAVAQETLKSDSTAEAAEFLKIARANLALFQIHYVESEKEIEPVENPVMRYTEPVRGPTQGTMWVWGRKGRPAAVLEMIREAGRQDWFCFHSTSEKPIKLTAKTGQSWTPKSSDLQFRLLPDAPPPADSSAGRMRQMKEFARRFSSYENWLNARHEMRVLPAPLYHYEDRDQQILDGAIFAIAVGTHPEATLFLEATQPVDASQPVWQFAVGRSGAAEIVVAYDGKEVHRMPRIETLPPPTNSYWRLVLKVADQGSK